MRLLHSTKLELSEFFGDAIPAYAILSHTWEAEEVTFQHMTHPHPQLDRMQGFFKIRACCAQAARDGFDWVWIDTCCIDKSSSSELSEAINSMYAWYRDSALCYAYLCDVPPLDPALAEPEGFRTAKWFTRGWCLQELIAPRQLEFYAADWTEIGTKSSLRAVVSDITGIRPEVLAGVRALSTCMAAEKMSWASARRTSRLEDMAYCLLGLFDVHMPLLYGEGDRAFIRLQETILATTEDYSLFLWAPPPGFSRTVVNCFCPSPECFPRGGLPIRSPDAEDTQIYPYTDITSLDAYGAPPFLRDPDPDLNPNPENPSDLPANPIPTLDFPPAVQTPRGFKITLLVKPTSSHHYHYLAWLNCWTDDEQLLLCINLRLQTPPTTSTAIPTVHRDPKSPSVFGVAVRALRDMRPQEVYFSSRDSAAGYRGSSAASWMLAAETRTLEVRLVPTGVGGCALDLVDMLGAEEAAQATPRSGGGRIYTLDHWHRKIALLLRATTPWPGTGSGTVVRFFAVVASFAWPGPWVYVTRSNISADGRDGNGEFVLAERLKWASWTGEPPTADRVAERIFPGRWVRVSARQLGGEVGGGGGGGGGWGGVYLMGYICFGCWRYCT